jgi:hypothetical protein
MSARDVDRVADAIADAAEGRTPIDFRQLRFGRARGFVTFVS